MFDNQNSTSSCITVVPSVDLIWPVTSVPRGIARGPISIWPFSFLVSTETIFPQETFEAASLLYKKFESFDSIALHSFLILSNPSAVNPEVGFSTGNPWSNLPICTIDGKGI